MLWGRSGNRCSICKIELVIEATTQDAPSVIGEECHIISGQVNGPRYNSNYDKELIDSYENLILLCSVHHKMIDDQQET
ncbi:HNH endonuclease [Paenibacillus oralis]|uniref:HNH endonuclease n=1 Tax=Paenibacillus oralis TaxID=2490856 RepID=A0A3P3UEB2_9BACL|nr:HNH endonuclease [Paenibacillus oralis]